MHIVAVVRAVVVERTGKSILAVMQCYKMKPAMGPVQRPHRKRSMHVRLFFKSG
jgi:hypothetical protein